MPSRSSEPRLDDGAEAKPATFGNPNTQIGTAARPDARRRVSSAASGTEIVASLLGGRRFCFGERWAFDLTLHLDQKFADCKIRDRVSRKRGAVDDYLTYGGNLALVFRF